MQNHIYMSISYIYIYIHIKCIYICRIHTIMFYDMCIYLEYKYVLSDKLNRLTDFPSQGDLEYPNSPRVWLRSIGA